MSDYKHINEPLSEVFRDRVATIDELGKRKWVYASKPSGKFYFFRTWLSLGYFLLFFGLPFVKIGDRPLFMFNIPKAQFVIFGKIFWPQDFFIFGMMMVAFVFFIILFTAAFGRLFCGWACPQTNFMEMMFRKVEFWVLGDAAAQKALDKAPWTSRKIGKLCLKHFLFYLLSFVIANFFLAYIIGIDALEQIMVEPITQHIVGFSSILAFSAVFYAVYAFFREQACTVVCPYGRLQSVLLDKNSMIVAYDYKRGEPRGNAKKVHDESLGDCIDCHQCVRVCPTGIDIRNGLQMECVGCTACIDACDQVMSKVHKPKGLIRYASENSIANGDSLKYTTRMKLYTGLCLLVISLLVFLLSTRKDIGVTIMRTPGQLYQERGMDSIANLYNIKLSNKTSFPKQVSISVTDGNGHVEMIGKPFINVVEQGQGAGSFFVVLPKSSIKQRSSHIHLTIFDGEAELSKLKTNFLGPVN